MHGLGLRCTSLNTTLSRTDQDVWAMIEGDSGSTKECVEKLQETFGNVALLYGNLSRWAA